MNELPKYRVYKISIQLPFISNFSNSKVYEIKPGRSVIIPGLKYSFLTLLFGWWTFSIFKWLKRTKLSLLALHINFSGGEDYSRSINQGDVEKRTIWVYDNLPQKNRAKINIKELDIILELLDSIPDNEILALSQLRKIEITNLETQDLDQIGLTNEQYEFRSLE